jgi:hypothetical protein
VQYETEWWSGGVEEWRSGGVAGGFGAGNRPEWGVQKQKGRAGIGLERRRRGRCGVGGGAAGWSGVEQGGRDRRGRGKGELAEGLRGVGAAPRLAQGSAPGARGPGPGAGLSSAVPSRSVGSRNHHSGAFRVPNPPTTSTPLSKSALICPSHSPYQKSVQAALNHLYPHEAFPFPFPRIIVNPFRKGCAHYAVTSHRPCQEGGRRKGP